VRHERGIPRVSRVGTVATHVRPAKLVPYAVGKARIECHEIGQSEGAGPGSFKFALGCERGLERTPALADESVGVEIAIDDGPVCSSLEHGGGGPGHILQFTRVHLAYLKARHHWGTWTREGAQKALLHLREAMQADPGFAPAYSMLSFCMITVGYWGYLPHNKAYSQARRATLEALKLDETLGEPHVALGMVNWLLDWKPQDCEGELRRAIELHPSSKTAHLMHSLFLVTVPRDHDGAIEAARLALGLDPLSVNTNFQAAYILVFAGEYEQAIDQARGTSSCTPIRPRPNKPWDGPTLASLATAKPPPRFRGRSPYPGMLTRSRLSAMLAQDRDRKTRPGSCWANYSIKALASTCRRSALP